MPAAFGEDALIAQAAGELFTVRWLGRETETALAAELGRDAVFDLIATVGFYSVLGFILMTYETPLDAEVAEALRVSPLSGSRHEPVSAASAPTS
ncbi:hypothetical protein [Paracoccus sp. S-4012]|uniref:hypothetical protein n=1 Tax=Paracoccus sp. S-4012 TaxID=2665648 RepID=UPI0018A1F9A6|nr:hypothetical protein [Paracoccus sp. S-4012]